MNRLGQKEFHIAPMIDVSTIEFRYFIRLLTKRAVIWNQMVVAETLVYRSGRVTNNRNDCKEGNDPSLCCELSSLSINGSEHDKDDEDDVELNQDLIKYCGWYKDDFINPHPTVCQIGSNNPAHTEFATRIVRKIGYDSIDLNCECPSDRVAGRNFGAALMKDQDAAVKIVSSMVQTAQQSKSLHRDGSMPPPLPVSVKTRIGVDEKDGFEFIASFIQRLVEEAGCKQFVIHARKVYTKGLNPAQNRTIPPLDYPCVYRLMEHFPQCSFLINGGIMSLEHAREVAFGRSVKFDECGDARAEDESCSSLVGDQHAVPCQRCNLPRGSCLGPPHIAPPNLRGVMVGRLARDRPADLADVDRYFYGEATNPCINRRVLMERYISFLERVYPRRCCDDDERVTLDLVRDVTLSILPKQQCCSVCEEFRGRRNNAEITTQQEEVDGGIAPKDDSMKVVQPAVASSAGKPNQTRQSGKRSRRHSKYNGVKIVTRIIDRAIQPTWGILAGEKGKIVFCRVSHELSRDRYCQNCGPGYILWKAMESVPDEIWDKPFELSDGRKTTYYPSK